VRIPEVFYLLAMQVRQCRLRKAKFMMSLPWWLDRTIGRAQVGIKRDTEPCFLRSSNACFAASRIVVDTRSYAVRLKCAQF